MEFETAIRRNEKEREFQRKEAIKRALKSLDIGHEKERIRHKIMLKEQEAKDLENYAKKSAAVRDAKERKETERREQLIEDQRKRTEAAEERREKAVTNSRRIEKSTRKCFKSPSR